MIIDFSDIAQQQRLITDISRISSRWCFSVRPVVLNGVVAVQTNQNCGRGQLLNAMKISVGSVTTGEARETVINSVSGFCLVCTKCIGVKNRPK